MAHEGQINGPDWSVAWTADDQTAAITLLTTTHAAMVAGDNAATASQSDGTGSTTCTYDGIATTKMTDELQGLIDDPP